MSEPTPVAAPGAVDQVQRRILLVLVLAQALNGLGMTIGIATASLLARDLAGSDTLAGLAQTSQVVGAAAAAYLLAGMMAARGRRVGLVAAVGVAAAGALLAVLSGVLDLLAVLLIGALLMGGSTAANNASRYAAVDLAPALHRGRDLSLVVWATTLGAVVGPNLTGPAATLAEAFDLPALTGPFVLGAVAMAGAGIVLALGLRPDPLLLARARAAEDAAGGLRSAPSGRRGIDWTRVRAVLRARPEVAAAVAAMAATHAVMVAVMVMTPLHMEHGGAGLEVIGFVISVHVLGMFAFAPLVGIAADRWGRGQVVALGAVVLLVALGLAGTSPEGHSWHIAVGLFLLGLGWSLVTVAASTVVVDGTPVEDRTDVQGAADLAMGLVAAVGGAIAGVVVGWLGFAWLAGGAAVLTLAALLAAARVVRIVRTRSDTPHTPA